MRTLSLRLPSLPHRLLLLALCAGLAACGGDSDDGAGDAGPEIDPVTDAYLDAGDLAEVAPPEDTPTDPEFALQVTRARPAEFGDGVMFDECMFASPLAYDGLVLVAAGERIAALSPDDGSIRWEVTVPAPEGEEAFVVATPALVGDLLVVGYHTTARSEAGRNVGDPRLRQMMAVVDLQARSIDTRFAPVELAGDFESNDPERPLPFLPGNAILRSTIAHIPKEDGLGWVYAAFGNVRDIQPWHGFIFEVDLDAWAADAAGAISARLSSTAEPDCGAAGASGSRMRRCGGGIWAPSGHLVTRDAEGWSIVFGTGNGQISIPERNFANSLMRARPGLQFDHGCDEAACADFDADQPSLDCLESCRDLFMARESAVGDPMPLPESGACDGMTMFQCWGNLDYIGGSTPVEVTTPGGTRVFAYPAKDGAVWLIDAENMGVLHDRVQMVSICGTPSDPCVWDWAGMAVTEPAVTELNGAPLLLVPTFMPDRSHPAGVVALRVVDGAEGPRLETVWQAPSFARTESVSRFRRHPSRLTLHRISEGLEAGFVVETAAAGGRARLLAIRTWDGAILQDVPLAGPGYRFIQPLIVDDRLFAQSCRSDNGPSTLEAFDIEMVEVR